MPKKRQNLILLSILAGLVLIFVFTKTWRSLERSPEILPENLISLDSSKITSVTIINHKGKGSPFEFVRTDGNWKLSGNGKTVAPDMAKIGVLLQDIGNVSPTRVVSKTSDSYEKYQLTDSATTEIRVVQEGLKEPFVMHIGKFSYRQSQGGGMGQMGGVQGTTYIRFNNDERVYSVEGFLAMRINQDFNAWRNSTFLKTRAENMQSIEFKYPADTGFVIIQDTQGWQIGDQEVDSAAMSKYLNQIANRPQNVFADDVKPDDQPVYSIVINQTDERIVLDVFQTSDQDFLIHSSLNPEAWFITNWTEILGQLFVGKDYFLNNK